MLDIEGLPDRAFYYLIGALVVCGQSQKYHSFWADDQSSEPAIFTQLAELLTATGECQVFHYGNYDAMAVPPMLSHVPEPGPEIVKDDACQKHERTFDHQLSHLFACAFQ